MKRRNFLAVAAAVIAAPLAFVRKATHIKEPVRLKRILRWNPETKKCGVVLRMKELRCGDKFIMYQRDKRMPKYEGSFYTAITDPWIATNERGLEPGQWTIDAEWKLPNAFPFTGRDIALIGHEPTREQSCEHA